MQTGHSPPIKWSESEELLFTLCKQETETHNQRRLQSLCLLRQGKSFEEVARTTGVHPGTVRQWVAWYRQGGVEEVRRHRAGRYRNGKTDVKKLSAETPGEQAPPAEPQPEPPATQNANIVPTHYQFEAGESVSTNVKRIITE